MLMKIDNVNGEHVCLLLHCLTVAARPIRIEELAEVLGIDIGDAGGSRSSMQIGSRCIKSKSYVYII
jgi:hypothetical protein